MAVDVRNRPRGIVQGSYRAGDGRTMWLIHWQRGDRVTAVASDLPLKAGQAVFLTADGQLGRVR